MPRWAKRGLTALVVLAALGAPLYWWLLIENPAPEGQFSIDLAEVRRLARSGEGDLPTELRVEKVGNFEYPSAATVAGNGWSPTALTIFSYQIVYPTTSIIVDTGMSEATASKNDVKHIDRSAIARIVAAMNDAATSKIVVTHEHFDHLGGLADQANLVTLLEKTVLTAEQAANASQKVEPCRWPAGVLDGYKPIVTGPYFMLAPGVVLIKAAGHTPGSQMVYVQRADGLEYLIIGDVAWLFENIERLRGRPALVSKLIDEDRASVMRQVLELNRLSKREPTLHVLPGHDAAPVEALLSTHLLGEHFL